MAVPSLLFLAFAALAALAHGLSRTYAWRRAVMLVVNIGFLVSFCHAPRELAPYVVFLLVGYVAIRLTGAGVGGRVHALAIALLLAGFFWLKRYSFLPAQTFLTFDYLTVGLSYVFFRVIHLAITARDDPDAGTVGPLEYINYTLNFTSLVSGPIQGFEDYKRMTDDEPASLTLADTGSAIERIIVGLFKFSALATLVAFLQNDVTARLASHPALPERVALMVVLTAAYPIFLFFNFSGYTSFVIGVARFFRLELPENFNQPFRATSFIDYWSRWHMSLSNWLKAHVYNPLLLTAARRVTSPKLLPLLSVGALFITFFLIGIWHGRTWHFFIFGLLNGTGVAINQFYRLGMQRWLGTAKFLRLSTQPLYMFVCRGVTFGWVAFTLLWFWSDTPELGGFAQRLGPVGLAAAAEVLVIGSSIGIGTMLAGRHLVRGIRLGGAPLVESPYVRTIWATLMLLSVIAINVAMAGDTGEVVYKGF